MAAIQRENAVAFISDIVARAADLSTEAAALTVEINTKTKRLEEINAGMVKAKKELAEELTRMDVSTAQQGNYGWEQRSFWFFIELHRITLQRKPA